MRVLTAAFVAPALLAQLTTAKTVTTTTTHTHHAVKLTAAQVDAELHARQAHATAYSNGVSVNTTIVGAWRQCAAKSWVAPCTTGTVCVARSDLYSECIPTEYVERRADGRWVFKHGEPIVEVEVDVDYVVSEAGEWEQCLWEDRRLACAPGLQCVETHPWFGQCVTLEAGVGEQCAGPHWKAKCVAGSSCVKRDELYSECVANERHVHNREHVVRHWVEDEDVVVHHHRREGRAAQWEQCKWEHDEIECAPGLQCAVQSKFFGQCVKRDALLWEQCGGLNWVATCEPGSTCVKRDDKYSQCKPIAAEEYVNHEHHHHHHHHHHNHHVHHHEAPKHETSKPKPQPKLPVVEIGKEWEQCKWDDKLIDCATGLQCAIRDNRFGQCVRTSAVAWQQCGSAFWTATCSAGNTCVKRDENFSQCVPNDRLDHFVQHNRERIVHTTEHVHRHPAVVREGEQCKWAHEQLECAAGLHCSVSSPSFGKCVKNTIAFWEQCAGIDWSSACAAGSTCVKRDDHYSQCIPNDQVNHQREEVRHYHENHFHDGHYHDNSLHKHVVYEVEDVVVPRAKAGEFEQCKWENDEVECAAGLQCAVESDWFGQCVKREAELWGQCGGRHWLAACPVGSKCVHRRDDFKQCLPVA